MGGVNVDGPKYSRIIGFPDEQPWIYARYEMRLLRFDCQHVDINRFLMYATLLSENLN